MPRSLSALSLSPCHSSAHYLLPLSSDLHSQCDVTILQSFQFLSGCYYVYGGREVSIAQPLSELWKLDLSNIEAGWTSVQTRSPPPLGSFGQSGVLYKHSWFIYGDMIATTNLHEFNFKRMEWTVQPSSSNKKISKPRTFQSTVLYGDTIIIYGGKTSDECPSGDILKFDIPTKTWDIIHAKGQKPKPRQSHSAWVSGDYMFVYGGIGPDEVMLDDVAAFDLRFNAWIPIRVEGPIPAPREHALHVAYKRHYIFFLGADSDYLDEELKRPFALYIGKMPVVKWFTVKCFGQHPYPVHRGTAVLHEESRRVIIFGGQGNESIHRHILACTLSTAPVSSSRKRSIQEKATCLNCGSLYAWKRCGNCRQATYCSRQCQLEHFPVHSKACKPAIIQF